MHFSLYLRMFAIMLQNNKLKVLNKKADKNEKSVVFISFNQFKICKEMIFRIFIHLTLLLFFCILCKNNKEFIDFHVLYFIKLWKRKFEGVDNILMVLHEQTRGFRIPNKTSKNNISVHLLSLVAFIRTFH